MTPTLPVIDVADLASEDHARQAATIRALNRACEHNGFFYASGHGIAPELIDGMIEQARAFFSLDEPLKMEVSKKNSRCNRGYDPLGDQRLDPTAPPDLKEGFFFGTDLPATHPLVARGAFSLGPNQVPSQPAGFGSAMAAYHRAMQALSVRIMRGLALSLDLDEAHFDEFSRGPMAVLRLLHYPPQPAQAAPKELGCGEHTDFGGITVLYQDDAGGLEIWSQQTRAWIAAPPMPGTFVVNLGDMLGRWTNDRYKSTLHRVINRSGRERYSMPFFLSGHPDMVVRCLPTCTDATHPPRYEPTTVEAHFKMKFEQSYGR